MSELWETNQISTDIMDIVQSKVSASYFIVFFFLLLTLPIYNIPSSSAADFLVPTITSSPTSQSPRAAMRLTNITHYTSMAA